MSDLVQLRGAAELLAKLGRDPSRQQQAALIAVAEEAHGRIAPYPSRTPITGPGLRWYERGYGQRYLRKTDGKTSGRKTSQMLGRRWRVLTQGQIGAVLRNTASYSGWVHRAEAQTKQHAATGWKTDRDVIEEMQREGVIGELLMDATLKGMGLK